jgi:glutathione S-transferase
MAVRFGARTVPVVRLDGGERVVGSRAIMRRLEQLVPEPPLFPPGGEPRALVERAEEWGEEVLQPLVRRLLWASARRRPRALASYAAGSGLRLPRLAIHALAPAVTRIESRLHHAGDGPVRADLRALPRHLDRIDGWIAESVLGGSRPNAADLQIGASIRLLATIGDAAPFLDGRPAAAHARALFAPQPGATPAGLLPSEWLAGSWSAPPRQ